MSADLETQLRTLINTAGLGPITTITTDSPVFTLEVDPTHPHPAAVLARWHEHLTVQKVLYHHVVGPRYRLLVRGWIGRIGTEPMLAAHATYDQRTDPDAVALIVALIGRPAVLLQRLQRHETRPATTTPKGGTR